MENLLKAGWFLFITLGWLLATYPIITAYTSIHLMNNFKVLGSIFVWMMSNFIVAIMTINFIL